MGFPRAYPAAFANPGPDVKRSQSRSVRNENPPLNGSKVAAQPRIPPHVPVAPRLACRRRTDAAGVGGPAQEAAVVRSQGGGGGPVDRPNRVCRVVSGVRD